MVKYLLVVVLAVVCLARLGGGRVEYHVTSVSFPGAREQDEWDAGHDAWVEDQVQRQREEQLERRNTWEEID